jgi:hypothetical protein
VSRQAIAPVGGGVYINETATKQAITFPGVYINETQGGIGVLQVGAATVSGIGFSGSLGSGTLQVSAAAVQATGLSGSEGIGILVSDDAILAGIAVSRSLGVGVLQMQPAHMRGFQERAVATGLLRSGDFSVHGFGVARLVSIVEVRADSAQSITGTTRQSTSLGGGSTTADVSGRASKPNIEGR